MTVTRAGGGRVQWGGFQKWGKPKGAGGQRLWCGMAVGGFVLEEGVLLMRCLETSPTAARLVLLPPGFAVGILSAA